jgi:hypothetical protein
MALLSLGLSLGDEYLPYLPGAHGAESFGEDLENTGMLQLRYQRRCLGQEVVAGQHGCPRRPDRVERLTAPSQGGLIHQVVVYQRGGVQHLHRSRQAVEGRGGSLPPYGGD